MTEVIFIGSITAKSGAEGDVVFLKDDIKKFLSIQFEKDDVIEFRLIRGKEDRLEKWWTLDEINYDWLKQQNEADYHIYYGVNPRPKKGDKGDDCIKICRCVLVDFDRIKPENFNLRYVQSRIERRYNV